MMCKATKLYVYQPRGHLRPQQISRQGRFSRVQRGNEVFKRQNAASTEEVIVSGSFDFKAYMKERAMIIQEALDKALEPEEPRILTDAMRYSAIGTGKKIRPAVCLAACELVGGKMEMAMPTACACEMIHSFTLVHDDLPSMDNDDFRRGKETTHIKFGESIAILAGDTLQAFAFEHIVRDTVGVPAERLVKVISILTKNIGVKGVAGGQVLDIISEGKEVDYATLEKIHYQKTCALFEASVLCGAVIGGATDEQLERLAKYSYSIGLAFQVVDDILDITQTTEQLGKTAAKDLASDKTTYPKLVGLERSKEIARDLINDAIQSLEGFNQEKAAPLISLAEYVRDRQK